MLIQNAKEVEVSVGEEVVSISPLNCKEENILSTTYQNESSSEEENDLNRCTERVSKLKLDSDYSSSSEEETSDDETYIAKCPDKVKDLNKQRTRSEAAPYQNRPLFHGSGGGLIDSGNIQRQAIANVSQNASGYNIPIPTPVEEISYNCLGLDYDSTDVNSIWNNLTPKQQQVLGRALDTAAVTEECPPFESPLDGGSLNSDYINTPEVIRSVDSTYGTLSSPDSFTVMSPTPGYQPVHRLSTESDTSGFSTSPARDSISEAPESLTEIYQTFNSNDLYGSNNPECSLNTAEVRVVNGVPSSGPARLFKNQERQSVPMEMKPPPTVTIPPPCLKGLTTVGRTPPLNILQKARPLGVPPLTSVPAPLPSPPSPRTPVGLPNIRPGGVPVPETNMLVSGMLRILPRLQKSRLKVSWLRLLLQEKVFEPDDSGLTSLMKAIREVRRSSGYLEEIYCLLTLAGREKRLDYLKAKNTDNHTALYMAAVECSDKPLIARCLTDVFVTLDEDPDEVYDEEQNSLLHVLCQYGDSRMVVMAELLNTKFSDGKPCFPVNKVNLLGESPLHTAVKTHNYSYSSLSIARLLISHGASIAIQNSNGITPLMAAVKGKCDPAMVNILLRSNYYVDKDVVNLKDRQLNTALHHAASNNNIPLVKQMKVVSELINAGATHNSHNMSGRVALSLVDASRKDAIRNILHRKS